MKNNIKGLVSIFSIALLASCTESMDVELFHGVPKLVVEGSFTNELKHHRLVLSKSGEPSSSEQFEKVSGANVMIYSTEDTFFYHELTTIQGVYETVDKVAGKPGLNYTLKISNVNINNGTFSEYTATEFMPPSCAIDSIVLDYKEGFHANYFEVNAYLYEPDTFGNVYLFNIYKNDTLITDSLHEENVQFDYAFNGKYLYGAPVGRLRDDDVREKVNIGDTIRFDCGFISEDFGTYIYEQQNQLNGTNPLFSGPSANVKGNIEPDGLALGYFAVYSVYSKSIVRKE